MIISTQDQLADYVIVRTFGLVKGNTVRSRNIARNFIGNLRTIFGGEIPEFTKVVAESREQALDRLIKESESLGANAIVGLRFVSTEVNKFCSEILAYGTAVLIREKQ